MTEVVAWAASNGDRSENADYQYGTRRLRQIDGRIRFLTKQIESAEVIDPETPRAGQAIWANVDKAAGYYVNTLGFNLDWGDDQGGIAGISRGNCRLFITNHSFRESYGNIGPVLFWLNLNSKAEVDELFAQWKTAQAKIVSEPEDKPWKLREFIIADLDGNLIRVFYDFRGDI